MKSGSMTDTEMCCSDTASTKGPFAYLGGVSLDDSLQLLTLSSPPQVQNGGHTLLGVPPVNG